MYAALPAEIYNAAAGSLRCCKSQRRADSAGTGGSVIIQEPPLYKTQLKIHIGMLYKSATQRCCHEILLCPDKKTGTAF